MKYFTVQTPTTLDVREIFTLGLGTKRDSDKIGHKGSGLKFTLALLHRLGSSLHVSTEGYHLNSDAVQVDIRGTTHSLIKLFGSHEIDTHISQNAGSDTWNEPWFALRELITNAMDEGGSYSVEDSFPNFKGGTLIVVPLTEQLQKAWDNRHSWFHSRHSEVIYSSDAPGLYFHGFNVYKGENWKYAYDITGLITRDQLSEDRQLRNVDFSDLFTKILKAGQIPDDFYTIILKDVQTQDIEFLRSAVYNEITETDLNPGGFEIAKLERAAEQKFGPRVAFTTDQDKDGPVYYHARAAGYSVGQVPYYTACIMRYSHKLVDAAKILPEVIKRIKQVKEIGGDCQDRLKQAIKITRKLRPPYCRIQVTAPKYENDNFNADAYADPANNRVYLMESFVNRATTEELVEALIEEYVHITSKASDGSISFEKALIKTMARLLYPKRMVEGEL